MQDWIDRIPQIFHDEMNGYGFELDFSGTALDYEELCSAFLNAGVSKENVHVFHKSEIESREDKVRRIKELLDWLNDDPYRKFDVKAFRRDNYDLFDEDYTYIVLHGEITDHRIDDVTVENVNNVKELESTDLTHTPILYYISAESVQYLSDELYYLKSRNDINDNQLFFYIDDSVNKNKIIRFIVDLGISKPCITTDFYGDAIRKYFLVYPITDYINSSIKAFNMIKKDISDIISDDNQKGKIEGDETLNRTSKNVQ